jgi:Spy/CpxP family protein refolding chaperone
MKTLSLAALVVAAWIAPVRAEHGGIMSPGGPPPGPPSFLRKVFPLQLVMEHQHEIGLRPAQADAIKRAINDAQQQLVDLEWRLNGETEALGKLLDADKVDEAAVVAKLEQVTAIEQQVKKTNFTLLVRVKNQLDPDQQAKLRALRPTFGPPGPPPPPPGE